MNQTEPDWSIVEMSGSTPAPTPAEQDRDQIIRAAYTAAGARLRGAHHDEFIKYQVEECQRRGLEWHPRQTAEERASSEFDRLLTEYPHLRDRLPTDGPAEDVAETA